MRDFRPSHVCDLARDSWEAPIDVCVAGLALPGDVPLNCLDELPGQQFNLNGMFPAEVELISRCLALIGLTA